MKAIVYTKLGPPDVLRPAIQEMIFAISMIVKGFNPSAFASEPAKVDINQGENDVAKTCISDRLSDIRQLAVERLPIQDKHW